MSTVAYYIVHSSKDPMIVHSAQGLDASIVGHRPCVTLEHLVSFFHTLPVVGMALLAVQREHVVGQLKQLFAAYAVHVSELKIG